MTHTLQSEIDAINAELNKVNIPELAQQAVDIYEKVSSFGELETKVNNSDNVNVQDLVTYMKSMTGLSTLTAGVSLVGAAASIAASSSTSSVSTLSKLGRHLHQLFNLVAVIQSTIHMLGQTVYLEVLLLWVDQLAL